MFKIPKDKDQLRLAFWIEKIIEQNFLLAKELMDCMVRLWNLVPKGSPFDDFMSFYFPYFNAKYRQGYFDNVIKD